MSARRRVLVLAPFAPSATAANGGARALAGLLGELTRRHDVALVCLRAAHEPPIDGALEERCATAEVVLREDRPSSRARRLARSAGGVPEWVAQWAVPEAEAAVARVAVGFAPEIVQVEFSVMAQYLPHVPRGARRVLVAHDPQVPAGADRVRLASGAARLVRRLELRAWQRFEARAYADVDRVVVFSERDRERIGFPCAAVIPLGLELPATTLDAVGEPGAGVLFVGNFNHFPNVEGALRLAREILPALPGTRATIVGPDPPAELRPGAGLIVTGAVPDVVPYLAAAEVVVAPLWSGGGSRVKVLETLAAGKALVATPVATAGIEGIVDGRELLVREDPRALAAAIAELLADPDRRGRLGAAARDWAEANAGWRRVVARYEEVWG